MEIVIRRLRSIIRDVRDDFVGNSLCIMLFGQRPLLLNLLFCCFKVNQFQIDRPHSLRVEQLEEFIMMFCSNELIPKSFLSCFGTTFGSKSTKGPAPNLLLNTSDLV